MNLLRTHWERLTPGQRWTCATAIVLAILLLLFGMPNLSGP